MPLSHEHEAVDLLNNIIANLTCLEALLQECGNHWELEDWCPRCLGELDAGWGCNNCGYDANSVALARPSS
jgi:hypothetical protein